MNQVPAIIATSANGFTIENCSITNNNASWALYVWGSDTDISVRKCLFVDNGSRVIEVQGEASCSLVGNIIDGSSGNALVSAFESGTSLVMKGNVLTRGPSASIVVSSGAHADIEDNLIHHSATGILLFNADVGITENQIRHIRRFPILTVTKSVVRVTDNVFESNGEEGQGDQGGIVISDSSTATIQGNTIREAIESSGIRLEKSAQGVVTGNIIIENTRGILVRDEGTSFEIADNLIVNNESSAIFLLEQGYAWIRNNIIKFNGIAGNFAGIEVSDLGTESLIEDNLILDNTGPDILVRNGANPTIHESGDDIQYLD